MKSTIFYLLGLLGLELSDVELEFFAFEDVTVGATDLAGARGDRRQNTTSLELLLQKRVDLMRTSQWTRLFKLSLYFKNSDNAVNLIMLISIIKYIYLER